MLCAATRSLVAIGQTPVTVGLFFSLGHSTIVVAMTIAIIIATSAINKLPNISSVGGLIGVSVSASFLFLLGALPQATASLQIGQTAADLHFGLFSRHQLGHAVAVASSRSSKSALAFRAPCLPTTDSEAGCRCKLTFSAHRGEIRQRRKLNTQTRVWLYSLSPPPVYTLPLAFRRPQHISQMTRKALKCRPSPHRGPTRSLSTRRAISWRRSSRSRTTSRIHGAWRTCQCFLR